MFEIVSRTARSEMNFPPWLSLGSGKQFGRVDKRSFCLKATRMPLIGSDDDPTNPRDLGGMKLLWTTRNRCRRGDLSRFRSGFWSDPGCVVPMEDRNGRLYP